MSRFYDISQTLRKGIPVWPGDPDFEIRWASLIREGSACNVAAFSSGTHTGTHLDAPFHVDNTGKDVSGLPLENLIGLARVCAIEAEDCIRETHLDRLDWTGVERVLFKTRKESPSDYFQHDYVYLDKSAAEFLIKRGMLLVGIDSPSVDAYGSERLSAHNVLLSHGATILENAQLSETPPGDYELICLPLKLEGLDGSPVRAVLVKK
jgi:arylformamidase